MYYNFMRSKPIMEIWIALQKTSCKASKFKKKKKIKNNLSTAM